jgi:hypothetical protein
LPHFLVGRTVGAATVQILAGAGGGGLTAGGAGDMGGGLGGWEKQTAASAAWL